MNPDQQSVLRDIQGLPPEVNIKALLIAMHTMVSFYDINKGKLVGTPVELQKQLVCS
ncbi:hypothetical protein [Bacillus cereus]|uniref:hypothetical protein n=1 Tax=Bacillus cereus TaxID=1396 RepID=UPI0002E56009|nr:hypothetical protein [Bacillus cereus]